MNENQLFLLLLCLVPFDCSTRSKSVDNFLDPGVRSIIFPLGLNRVNWSAKFRGRPSLNKNIPCLYFVILDPHTVSVLIFFRKYFSLNNLKKGAKACMSLLQIWFQQTVSVCVRTYVRVRWFLCVQVLKFFRKCAN